MSDPSVALRRLAERCLVLIDDRVDGGSGVWVAPGTILTCAHVVPAGMGATVRVRWEGRLLAGTVVAHTPNRSPDDLWSAPDLAIVTVDNVPEHPCAWLSEADPADEQKLVAFGYSVQRQEDGELRQDLELSVIHGRFGGDRPIGGGRQWLFDSTEILPGMSGGPVVDLATGAVCALVKGTTRAGGRLVPIQALRGLVGPFRARLMRDSDRFHRRHPRWSEIRGLLPVLREAVPGPVDEAELLGFLAELPEPERAELRQVYADCSRNSRPPDPDPDTWHDVARGLLDSAGLGPEDGIEPLLRLAERLSRPMRTDAETGLRDWATAFAARHGRDALLKSIRDAPAVAGPPTVVTVEISPACAEAGTFGITVSVCDAAGRVSACYCEESPRRTLAEVETIVGAELRKALCWAGPNTLIEFVVPHELFEVPFENWNPIRGYTTLGRAFRVVLRDLDRQHDAYTREAWIDRWKHLVGGSGQVWWATCAEDRSEAEFAAGLESEPRTAAVILSRRPGSTTATAARARIALESGVPAVAWRRGACAEHDRSPDHQNCSGARFATALLPAIESCTPSGLPALAQRIRRDVATRDPADATRECADIVLIWDDPSRAAEQASPLMEAPVQ